MRPISERIAGILADNGIFPEEDKPLYVYGLNQLGMTLLNLVSAIVIGVLFRAVWQCLVFLLAYIPLRKFAGGYHARTELRCFMISNALLCIVLLAMRLVAVSAEAAFLTLLIAGIPIILLSPVDSPKKPLDSFERSVYRRMSRIILLIHIGVALIFLFFSHAEVVALIALADVALTVMVVLGLLVNRKQAQVSPSL